MHKFYPITQPSRPDDRTCGASRDNTRREELGLPRDVRGPFADVLGAHVLGLDPSSKDRAAAAAHASSRAGQTMPLPLPCSIYPIFWQARHSTFLHLLLIVYE